MSSTPVECAVPWYCALYSITPTTFSCVDIVSEWCHGVVHRSAGCFGNGMVLVSQSALHDGDIPCFVGPVDLVQRQPPVLLGCGDTARVVLNYPITQLGSTPFAAVTKSRTLWSILWNMRSWGTNMAWYSHLGIRTKFTTCTLSKAFNGGCLYLLRSLFTSASFGSVLATHAQDVQSYDLDN